MIKPRPTKEEFTKYSFPSKDIEYMALGKPLITTNLPGMPNEYYDHVFLLEDETVDGYAKKIQSILHYSNDDLYRFGERAKQFILNKNEKTMQTSYRVAQPLNMIN